MRVLALLVLLLGACAVQRHAVMPVDLAREAGPLTREGRATVHTNDGAVEVSADELAFVHLRDADSETERPVTLTVRALVDGCDGNIDAPGCKAGRSAYDAPALTKKQYKFSGEKLATTLTFAAIGAGVGYCVAECKDSGGLEKGATYLAIGAGVFAGALLLFALAGGG